MISYRAPYRASCRATYCLPHASISIALYNFCLLRDCQCVNHMQMSSACNALTVLSCLPACPFVCLSVRLSVLCLLVRLPVVLFILSVCLWLAFRHINYAVSAEAGT